MSLHVMPLDEKLAAVETAIVGLIRYAPLRPTQIEALKAVATDIRARMELPRNNALGDLERAVAKLKKSKTDLGYEQREMVALAYVVAKRWPTIQQALECFGELSAE